ncbi:MCE family protein [[Mycobacterium] burgundiense]|uniref:MCE family protein n=1 Tax=[Mycobacterium] burgundiense TaxID=3064286 RepID=A0ABN9NWD4_9MYCO|nr:MCE family protein [Mycolicibacterium sp. MU0053]CAJ1511085.1 MCE family protein [Mycolicibacterium sp. MU0053]
MNGAKANVRVALAIAVAFSLVVAVVVAVRTVPQTGRTHVVAYFANSNGIFPGDEIRVLGVPVGEIDTIEPQPDRAKISFWVSGKYKVPADVQAVIISPQLVSARAIQLTPVFTGGPEFPDNGVIPTERTAVPVEWDDFREQLQTLTETLQPTLAEGVSPLGGFINTAAANLRGQGAEIRDTLTKLAQAFSALGDHSTDIFGTVKNLSILVTALQSSTDLMGQLNRNLASATSVLANDHDEFGQAISDIFTAADDVREFVAENREALGTSSDKLASISTAVDESLGDVKQALHVLPNGLQNFVNIFPPGNAAATGILAVNNFANPVSFLCGALQAASRLNAEQSAKLCVQYLAPIIKNRQYNFPPIGLNPVVGAVARPNEITHSEDWLRPDYRPAPPPAHTPLSAEGDADSDPGRPGPPATDPAAGLPGLMVPAGAGS